MSVPPNRIGGIRGPNGATLDDVVSELAGMRDLLSALVGPLPLPASWPGLTRAIGNPADEANTTVLGWHALLYARLELVLQKLGPVEGAAYLAAILGALEDGIGPDVAATATATGTIAGAMPGFGTLLGEIAANTLRSAECCEEGGGPGGEGPPENPCPTEFEPDLPCARIVGWVAGPEITAGGAPAKIYYPDWGGEIPVLGGDGNIYNIQYVHSTSFPYRGIFADSGSAWDVIVRWDFTTGITPVRVGSAVYNVPANEASAFLANVSIPDYGDLTRGAQTVFLDSPSEGAKYWQVHFVFAETEPGVFPTVGELGLNVFQGAGTIAS